MSEDPRDARIDALLRDLPSSSPPPGFADRVMAAREASAARRLPRLGRALAGIGALAAVLVVALAVHAPRSGDAIATGRDTVHVGDHVVAVLEPAAKVRFDVALGLAGLGGAVDVAQTAGSAFYRVDSGTPAVVHTPAGDVVAHGTCFTVTLEDSSMPPIAVGTRLAPAAVGAVVGALLTVVVLEGAVVVKNDHGEVAAGAGQTAAAGAGTAPTVAASAHVDPLALRRLRAEVADLKASLDQAQHSAGGDTRALVAENRDLRDKLRHDDEELALADRARADAEGKELAPPKDLAPRFTQQALLATFTSALKEAGVDGDVTHIDCDEYPCIVYGDVKVASDMDATKISDKLKGAKAFAPYGEDEDNSSWWRSLKNDKDGGVVDETHFGIALWPKSDDRSDDIGKRIGFRNQQMWDAMKTAKR